MSSDLLDPPFSARPVARPGRIGPRAAAGPATALIVSIGLALLLYRPWRGLPFDIRDFSEFLPLLLRNSSLPSRMQAFTEYYASQGRLNLLSYLSIILKWSVFGWHSAGWQLARFVQMCVILSGVTVILCRLGAAWRGAVAGAALFIVASTAAPAWTRLTMGEPLGVLAILGALWFAIGYQTTQHWRRHSVAIAVLLATALLAKEMLIVAAPFVLAIALSFNGPGRFGIPGLTSRNVRVLAVAAIAMALVLLPVAWTAVGATPERFAAQYGDVPLSVHRALRLLRVLTMPVDPATAPRGEPLLFPGNVAFLLVVAGGWSLALQRPVERSAAVVTGALALSLPVCTAIAYAPWPLFEDFYGLTCLLGSAMLVAFAVTFVERYAPRRAWAVYVGCVGMVAYSAMTAQHSARAAAARQWINSDLASAIAASSGRDSIIVAMHFIPPQRWEGTGPTLGRYAAATHPGARRPPVKDMLCRDTKPVYTAILETPSNRTMLVTYSDQCGTFPRPTQSFRRYYHYMYWPTLGIRTDSLRADVLTRPSQP